MMLLPIPTKRVLKRTHGMKLQLCCDLTIQEKKIILTYMQSSVIENYIG